MSAKEECDEIVQHGFISAEKKFAGHQWENATKKEAWCAARENAVMMAKSFDKAGYHKQIVGRLLEPFSHIKVVLTATEFDNFFWLRNHPDAQPEIQELAKRMIEARISSDPAPLRAGEWHVPYYEEGQWGINCLNHDGRCVDLKGNTLEDAKMISASCCAQISYRKSDDSLEKARNIYKRLVESKPMHASPFEHQATPIDYTIDNEGELHHQWEPGITHQDRFNDVWSANFKGWIQNRQLMPDQVCRFYPMNAEK